MLTIPELETRLKKAEEDKKALDAARETVRIRIYRYRKNLQALRDIQQLKIELDENPDA